jgi:hypothetical protein
VDADKEHSGRGHAVILTHNEGAMSRVRRKINWPPESPRDTALLGQGAQGFGALMSGLLPGQGNGQICPACGAENGEVERTGLAGCPLCYDALDCLSEDRSDVWKT